MKEAEPGRSILQKKLDAMTDLITTVCRALSSVSVCLDQVGEPGRFPAPKLTDLYRGPSVST